MSDRQGKLRIHVQESAGSVDVFRIDRAKCLAGLAEHPDLADCIDLSFGRTSEDLERALTTAEVLVVGNFDAKKLKQRAPKLRWIQSIFAGMEKLAPQVPEEIMLTNASGVHAPKAAEFAIGAMLMLNCGIPQFVEDKLSATWEPRFTPSIAGRTVAILGVGAMGLAVARHAKHFGLTVLGVARSADPRPSVDACFEPSWLAEVLPRADFVVITLPNTPETRGMINRRELDLLPKHAGIISIGRAQVLDHEALADKLAKSELAGAFLDVFEQEPLPATSPLWRTPRLIITPHCVVDDASSYASRSLGVFFDNLRRYLKGDTLNNLVDQKLGY
jgi:phosphoglycerate dehydrogenase-like enzyme